jgi:SAM-dependent methyltransferase
MQRNIFLRLYLRGLRLLGLKQLSWDKQFEDAVSCYGPRSDNTIRLVQALCGGGRMLEFGCGEGELPLALAPGSYSSYRGFDISAVAIQRAQRRVSSLGLGPSPSPNPSKIEFEACEIENWVGADEASLIVVEECIYYLTTTAIEAFLRKCMHCLTRDGTILVIVHSAQKHAKALAVCCSVCRVREQVEIGGRVFLTLAANLPNTAVVADPPLHGAMQAQPTATAT